VKHLQDYFSVHDPSLNLIIRMSVRRLLPFIQLFGLYVIVHGHYSPGGGFQGGVILGASFILLAVGFDLPTSLKAFPEGRNGLLCNFGTLVYIGTGAVCALVGGLFLDYSALHALIPIDPVEWRSLGIFIVEAGVGFTVSSVMISLFWDLSSRGQLDGGL